MGYAERYGDAKPTDYLLVIVTPWTRRTYYTIWELVDLNFWMAKERKSTIYTALFSPVDARGVRTQLKRWKSTGE